MDEDSRQFIEWRAKLLAGLEEYENAGNRLIEEVVHHFSETVKRGADVQPEFRAQTDRGVGIIGAAIVEAEIGEFIIAHLVNGNKKARDGKRMRTLFEQGQAMGSFGPQIALAYAMGLVTEDVYYDLDCIREMRNAFAHCVWYSKGKRRTRESVTFEQEDIKALALGLRCYKVSGIDEWQEKQKRDLAVPLLSANPRARYELTCQTLHLMLVNGQHPRMPIPLHYEPVKLI